MQRPAPPQMQGMGQDNSYDSQDQKKSYGFAAEPRTVKAKAKYREPNEKYPKFKRPKYRFLQHQYSSDEQKGGPKRRL